jgi:ribA/ribD-fused uncharacterized protein
MKYEGEQMKTREELLARIDAGEVFEYLFFWDEPKKEEVDIACLNQWYAADFAEYETYGFTGHYRHFATAEQYMMYRKASLFYDLESANYFLHTESPREVQLLGREVKNYDDEVWQNVSFNVVVTGNMMKFKRHDELREYLLSTGDKVLVEASPIDSIWGIGLHRDDERVSNPKEWLGENKLGFALMEVRAVLKEEEKENIRAKMIYEKARLTKEKR